MAKLTQFYGRIDYYQKKINMENKKIQKFLEEYGELTKKHGVDFAAYPVYVPNDKGTFDLTIQTQPIEVQQKKTLDEFIKKA